MPNSDLALDHVAALLLVGGRGMQLAEAYPDLPKPLIPIAGRPFLEWQVRWLVRSGIRNIVLVASYQSEAIEAWARRRQPVSGEKLHCYVEEEAMGTGGAVAQSLAAMPLLRDRPYTLIGNGDMLLLADLAAGLNRMESEKSLSGLLYAVPVADTSEGVHLDIQDGLITGMQDHREGIGIQNAGWYLMRTDWLSQSLPSKRCSLDGDVLRGALRHGAQLGVMTTNAPFIEITTPESIVWAEHFMKENKKVLKGTL